MAGVYRRDRAARNTGTRSLSWQDCAQRGMAAPFVLDGAMNGPMFLAYVKQCLVQRSSVAMSSSWTICRSTKSPAFGGLFGIDSQRKKYKAIFPQPAILNTIRSHIAAQPPLGGRMDHPGNCEDSLPVTKAGQRCHKDMTVCHIGVDTVSSLS
jgi:hypothetical protein